VDFIKDGYATKKIFADVKELGYNKPIEIQMEAAVAAAPAAGTKAEPAKETPGAALIREADELAGKNDFAGAAAKYEAAIQANPAFYKLYGNIGNMYAALGQSDKAIAAYQQFLA